MASGGPGDHWLTDILTWERPAFGEPVDSLVRDIDALGGSRLLADDEPLGRRLGQLWPRWRRVDAGARQDLTQELTALRDRLRREAVERGWEVAPD